MNDSKRKTTSLKVDETLWKEAKKYAIDKNINLSDLVERALKKEIGTNK